MNDQVTPQETAEILRLAEQTLAAPGDFVELGCYKGTTSVLLGRLLQQHAKNISPCGKLVENSRQAVEKPDSPVEKPHRNVENSSKPPAPKHLWIYDSFAGLPEKTREDASGAGANFKAGELLVTKREVIEKLRRHGLKTSSHPDPSTSTVIVKKAWFDDLTPADLPDEIAFAFCDGDLYGSIKTSLRLAYPRLARRGIIIVHDYNNPELPGSARAVDEFLRAHPECKLQVRHTLAILTPSNT